MGCKGKIKGRGQIGLGTADCGSGIRVGRQNYNHTRLTPWEERSSRYQKHDDESACRQDCGEDVCNDLAKLHDISLVSDTAASPPKASIREYRRRRDFIPWSAAKERQKIDRNGIVSGTAQ
jgi:hypothetical protein